MQLDRDPGLFLAGVVDHDALGGGRALVVVPVGLAVLVVLGRIGAAPSPPGAAAGAGRGRHPVGEHPRAGRLGRPEPERQALAPRLPSNCSTRSTTTRPLRA